MIVYSKTKQEFSDDVLAGTIDALLATAVKDNLGNRTGASEVRSWHNSLQYMKSIVDDPDIPINAGVALEYKIPQTNNRIDFILTGQNEEQKDVAVIVELKQWSKVEPTDKDGVVSVQMGYGKDEHPHPSYQAWSYAALLKNFNESVYEGEIDLQPCAYLHNYTSDGIIDGQEYQHYTDLAPLFLQQDAVKLREFFKRFVKYGDKNNVMYQIENGRIRPSKGLAEAINGMLKGNDEFVMIDEQKVVFETALKLARISNAEHKHVLIVRGGPGTGKSVVAINLLAKLTNQRLNVHYVSKNSAPRAVYGYKLTQDFKKSAINNLFKGSGGYMSLEPNTFDALIVDEAHRLNEKSGLYSNLGENQVKEIINAAAFSIFFLDEDQKVTLKDIGDSQEIRKWAKQLNAQVHEDELVSQFRCNGSDGYIAWLDNTLQIRETANETLEEVAYDFKVFDSPTEMRQAIFEKNQVNNKSRLVAGYCWNWISDKKPQSYDINIDDFDFHARWNLKSDGSLWLIAKESVNEIGCIHTCQGLELDYVGVIIGPDIIYRDGKIITDPSKRATTDKSIFGWKRLTEAEPLEGQVVLDQIIKNTYRTLMTRGMKGCYVYCCDKELAEYLKQSMI